MSYCFWNNASALDRHYHDTEWGIPIHDDRLQFEYISMEVMQCGLSWEIVLKKREIFRRCFDGFDYERIAKYNDTDVERILNTEHMIRSERKIRAIINNAKRVIEIREEFGSFDQYLWNFSDGKTILYDGHHIGRIPASNHLSEKISKDLKKRGFKYLGPITVYSHLQACGIINDHDENCPCYLYIVDHYPTIHKRRYGEKF